MTASYPEYYERIHLRERERMKDREKKREYSMFKFSKHGDIKAVLQNRIESLFNRHYSDRKKKGSKFFDLSIFLL